MVAIDSSFEPSPGARPETVNTGRLVGFAVLLTVLSAAVGFALQDGAGWATAADWCTRFALLIFVAAMTVEPLSRLIPVSALRTAARERAGLVMAFIAAMVLSIAFELAPWLVGGEPLPVTTAAYCLITGLILTVMLFSNHPATIRLLGAPSWRAMQRIASAYFWAAFMLISMCRMIGPHRPDNWHGFALLLLVTAVLLRFMDAFVMHWRGGLAEKVG